MDGRLNWPNHCNGKPAAEFITQPLIGTANSNAYSNPCMNEAMPSCHGGVPGTVAGRPAYRRHSRRATASARMVMPTDLWKAYTAILSGPRAMSPISRPTVPCASSSSTISQWKAWLTTPQRSFGFFRLMGAFLAWRCR
jgi:hypothetical protein